MAVSFSDMIFFTIVDYQLWIKVVHIVSFVAWMAGLLYLPRLFVYHSKVDPASESSELFKIMEKKLLRYIINPAMFNTLISGLLLAWIISFQPTWLHIKLLFVLALTACHGFFAANLKKFARDERPLTEKKWRMINEIPTLLLIFIVILVIVKPF